MSSSLAYRLIEPVSRLHAAEVVPFYLTVIVYFTLDVHLVVYIS